MAERISISENEVAGGTQVRVEFLFDDAQARSLAAELENCRGDLAHALLACDVMAQQLGWDSPGGFRPEHVCERPPKQADNDAAA